MTSAASLAVAAAHEVLTWAMLLAGPFTLVLGLLLHRFKSISAPYGRWAAGAGPGWGPLLNGRLAWMTQELPALLVLLTMILTSPPRGLSSHPHHPQGLAPAALQALNPSTPCGALAAAFVTHYTYRALVYPWRLRAPKGTALVVWGMATAFCFWNGFIQGYYLTQQCPSSTPPGWWPHQVAGLVIWLTGWLLNLHSDGILRNLRASPADTGYKIPRGGLFEWVSAANYTAEVIEWAGWSLAAWSPRPAAFALFTLSNLAPRASAHHSWYLTKFKGEYPSSRTALVPYLW